MSYLEALKRSSCKPPKGLTVGALASAWDVHPDTPRQAYLTIQAGCSRYYQRIVEKEGLTKTKKPKSVIDDIQFAKSVFTPVKLFLRDRLEKYKHNNPQYTKEELNKYQSKLPSLYKKLPKSTKELWITRAEDKIRRHISTKLW